MSAAISASRDSSWRLIAAALLVPALFVAIDWLLLEALAGRWRINGTMALTMAAFVIQIGVMGVICGRWVEWPVMRWLLYAWCWLLIDFQTLIAWAFASQHWSGFAFYASSVFAAQLGLAIILAVLGGWRWAIRLPVALVAASLLLLLLVHFRHWGDNAAPLFAVQTIALAGLCVFMRSRGYRLTSVERESLTRCAAQDALATTQFGLRDVLLWTTALALVLGAVRVIGLPIEQWLETRYRPWPSVLVDGAALAIVLVIALWGALGAGAARARWAVVLVGLPFIGIACGLVDRLLSMWQQRPWTAPWARAMSWPDWLYWQVWYPLWTLDRPVIDSICLAGALLFVTLLFLRSLGYRLVKFAPLAAICEE